MVVDSGYGFESLGALTEVPGTGIEILRRSTGYCGTGVHNSQKFRAGIKKLYPCPGYYGTGVQNSQKCRADEKLLYPYPGFCGTGVQNLRKYRVLWHGRT